ncbi:hypothetical protein ACTXT7_002522 [Hymenolepis weldensis]
MLFKLDPSFLGFDRHILSIEGFPGGKNNHHRNSLLDGARVYMVKQKITKRPSLTRINMCYVGQISPIKTGPALTSKPVDTIKSEVTVI